MQYEHFLGFLFAGLVAVSSAQFCGKFGSFDALCIQKDAVFMMSVSPCGDDTYSKGQQGPTYEQVSLTIIYTKDKFKKYDLVKSEDIKKPVWYGRKDVGFMLEIHEHREGSKEGYLHVTLSLGNFSDDGVNTRKTLMSVYFFMEKAGECGHDFSGASFYPAPACEISKRSGNYSTVCIAKESSSVDKKSKGIFVVAMDPCSVPASYWTAAWFPSKNISVVKKFTASKTDAFVPVENSKCGFKLKATPNDTSRYDSNIALALSYGCSDATAVQLINDYYFPQLGELCPSSSCTSMGSQRHKCKTSFLTGNSLSKSVTADVTLRGCSSAWSVEAVVNMEGQAYPLNLNFSKGDKRFADFVFEKGKQKMTEHKMPEIKNGYLPASNGHIFVEVEQLDHHDEGIYEHHDQDSHIPHLSYVVLERHYGDENGTEFFISNLFTLEYSLPPCMSALRGGHAILSAGVKALIALSFIAVVSAIAAVIYLRRRTTRNQLVGLPYQIELSDDGMDKEYL